MERDLTPTQVRLRLVLAARRIVADHVPVDGRCRLCRIEHCSAARMAAAFLGRTEIGRPGWRG
jgi:hypothetical protein